MKHIKFIYIFILHFFVKFVVSTNSCPNGTLPSLTDPLICYQFNSENTVFVEAEMICKNKDGHLASVTDGFTNAFLAQNANATFALEHPDFWVGGEDLDHKGQWVWTDGQPFAFQNWAPNEPDFLPGYQCISITKTRAFWYTTDCFDEKPFVCELPALALPTSTTLPSMPTSSISSITTSTTSSMDITTSTTMKEEISTTTLGPPSYSCDDESWAQFNDTHFCFKIFPKNVFDDAEAGCKSYGGHLASIHSQEELTFIDSLLDNYYYWLGLCTSDNGFTWVYTDGTSNEFAINHWCSNGPQHTADTCVVINPGTNCLTNIHKTLFTQALCKKFANISYGTL